jgi:hypothetical protein
MVGAAQAQLYYDGDGVIDNRHDSYGPTPEYPSKYTDRNSYEPTVKDYYENDNSYDNKKSYETNSYEPTTIYGMNDKKYNSYGYSDYGKDNNDRKSYDKKPYGNDNSYDKSQYQPSYKPDYKPQYPSYGKDKSKDSSSISLNKINCINNNVNINGNNTGDISVGNKGAAEGYLGASSSGGSGYGVGGYDGYKQGKGFDCIINNNNTNTNVVSGGGGNVTDTCAIDLEACFAQFLNTAQFQQLTNALNNGITVQIGANTVTLNNFAEMCDALEGLTFEFDSLIGAISDIAFQAGIGGIGGGIFECIAEALGIPITPTLT